MAKASTKKPKLTPEEQMAELARLTGSVAAISHMGTSQPFILPNAAPEIAPAPAATAPEAAPVPVEAAPPVEVAKPEPSVPVAPVAASEPAPQLEAAPAPAVSTVSAEPKGEETPTVVAPVPPHPSTVRSTACNAYISSESVADAPRPGRWDEDQGRSGAQAGT